MKQVTRCRRLGAVLAVLGLSCAPESRVHTGVVHIAAFRDDSPNLDLVDLCVRIPVLPGARRDESRRIEGSLEMHLAITRDDLTLTLDGAASPRQPQGFKRLEEPVSVPVERLDGAGFLLWLSPTCDGPGDGGGMR